MCQVAGAPRLVCWVSSGLTRPRFTPSGDGAWATMRSSVARASLIFAPPIPSTLTGAQVQTIKQPPEAAKTWVGRVAGGA
jgi:hypothetical protein